MASPQEFWAIPSARLNILRIAVVLAFGCWLPAAHAASASELFADGNRLFRDDLYWAALLRYREASEAGMDTPLLNFNMGVAHYRAKQHDRARRSLLDASVYAPLAPISHYNLGLNAYALGNHDEAMDWFRMARDQLARRDISRLASRAIDELQEELDAIEPDQVAAAIEKRDKKFTNLSLRIRTGVGTDDNVFRAPIISYVDLADPDQPFVEPLVQTGLFVPVSLAAKYQVNSLDNEGFFGSYRFGGRYYQDKNLKNADEYLHEMGFGSEYGRETENGETRVYSAFKIAQHDETYYDPDSGVERDIAGDSIGDRMSYLRYGPEFWVRKRFGPFTIGGRAKGQLWNYSDTDLVPEYDHEFWNMGINGQYRFTSTSLLRLTAEYYTRRFGDRPAYELDGTQSLGGPTIRYDYTEYGLEARQSITSRMWFSVGYARTERRDQYVGYNNYFRDDYSAAFHVQLGQRFDLEASARYNIYNYENAFAFHLATAGRKTLETATGRAVVTFRMTPHLDLIGEYAYRDVVSNDTRIQYTRGVGMLSVRWSQ